MTTACWNQCKRRPEINATSPQLQVTMHTGPLWTLAQHRGFEMTAFTTSSKSPCILVHYEPWPSIEGSKSMLPALSSKSPCTLVHYEHWPSTEGSKWLLSLPVPSNHAYWSIMNTVPAKRARNQCYQLSAPSHHAYWSIMNTGPA